jgi:pyrophosphatase PpaX
VRSSRFLVFDLDGTLIDSSAGVIEAVNYSLRMTRHPEREGTEISRWIGFPLEEMYAEFGVGPFTELYRHFQHRAAESVVRSSEPLEGVESTVRLLHERGWRMAIATTKVRRHVEAIIEKFGWRDMFHVLVGGDDVARVKPDPEAFRLAMSRLGANPEDTLVIGDTTNDVLAARAIPVRVVAVVSPYGGHENLLAACPDYVIDSISELPLLLNGNGER